MASLQEIAGQIDKEMSGDDEPLVIPDFLRDAYILAGERESLCKKRPTCPQCRTHQIQIIDVGNQKWKCRHCKNVFFTNYEI